MIRRFAAVLAVFLAAVSGAGHANASRPAPQPVIVRVEKGGFHWVDAAVGAAATLGAVSVGAAAWWARR